MFHNGDLYCSEQILVDPAGHKINCWAQDKLRGRNIVICSRQVRVLQFNTLTSNMTGLRNVGCRRSHGKHADSSGVVAFLQNMIGALLGYFVLFHIFMALSMVTIVIVQEINGSVVDTQKRISGIEAIQTRQPHQLAPPFAEQRVSFSRRHHRKLSDVDGNGDLSPGEESAVGGAMVEVGRRYDNAASLVTQK